MSNPTETSPSNVLRVDFSKPHWANEYSTDSLLEFKRYWAKEIERIELSMEAWGIVDDHEFTGNDWAVVATLMEAYLIRARECLLALEKILIKRTKNENMG